MDKKDTDNIDLKEPDWPNSVTTGDELDSALEAGEKSGVSPYTITEIAERTIARMKANGEL